MPLLLIEEKSQINDFNPYQFPKHIILHKNPFLISGGTLTILFDTQILFQRFVLSPR